MHTAFPGSAQRPTRDAYTKDLGELKTKDPVTKSTMADCFLAQGGTGAERIFNLSFYSANVSYIHDVTSQVLGDALTDLPLPEDEPEAHLTINMDFHGFLLLQQISGLFAHLLNYVPAQRQHQLTLHSNHDSPRFTTQADASQRAIDASLASFRSDSANRNIAQYKKPNGLESTLSAQKANEAQSAAIRKAMSENLESLRKDGLKIGSKTLNLDEDGGDCIGGEDFDPAKNTEWCLLRTENNYQFITAETVANLIKNGNKHPLNNNAPLHNGDIIRGQAVLDILKNPATDAAVPPAKSKTSQVEQTTTEARRPPAENPFVNLPLPPENPAVSAYWANQDNNTTSTQDNSRPTPSAPHA